ncbi:MULTISPECIES: hypothetical protein [unclassified Holdemania]|uniref:hypothetical protein n=1 Tax=unclassified Holdemania TaxID=2637685 RepID=UPI000933DD12|nr:MULTISPECIES: hypothetical protein [unclassified Holdemania]
MKTGLKPGSSHINLRKDLNKPESGLRKKTNSNADSGKNEEVTAFINRKRLRFREKLVKYTREEFYVQ